MHIWWQPKPIFMFSIRILAYVLFNMSRGGVYDPPPGLCKPVCIVAGPRSVYAIDMLDEHSDTVGTATTGGTVKHKPTYVVKALHQLHETFGQVPLTLKSPRHLAFIENNLYIFDLDENLDDGVWSSGTDRIILFQTPTRSILRVLFG